VPDRPAAGRERELPFLDVRTSPMSFTFNLYDTGAVAEAELLQAMRQAGVFPVAPGTLLDDLAAQLRAGQAQAKDDPFALGTQLGAEDASPHAFGLFITDALYRK
jgi:hypothetical protein